MRWVGGGAYLSATCADDLGGESALPIAFSCARAAPHRPSVHVSYVIHICGVYRTGRNVSTHPSPYKIRRIYTVYLYREGCQYTGAIIYQALQLRRTLV